MIYRNLLWTDGFTFVFIRTVPKSFFLHCLYHRKHTPLSFGLTLWKDAQVFDFCGHKKHR